MTIFESATQFDGTPAEMYGLASNAELLDRWDAAVGRLEAAERAAATEDAVICGHSSH
jgi:hypothetical protein